MAHKENFNRGNEAQNRSGARRVMDPSQAGHGQRPADQQHDAKGRQGSFEGKGEHARTGNRGHQ
jgi:hypothetical protein